MINHKHFKGESISTSDKWYKLDCQYLKFQIEGFLSYVIKECYRCFIY